ncbi:MAG: aminoacyl-tRNA hydrolase [Myxococcales bacterium]|nr:aminoacyl-tRNA hydrolase [Myxococcales bacterium]
MWMVVGLGNPGPKYARNRHNIGFEVVDELASKHGFPEWKRGKLGGDSTQGMLTTSAGRTKALLIKPMEYMNLSGFAVQRFVDFHQVDVKQVLVVHDEIDLDFGLVRIKAGGGHGGHNGLRSMIEQLGEAGFVRVRMGVGKPGPVPGTADGGAAVARAQGMATAAGKDKDVAGWVLADFPSHQAATVRAMIKAAVEAVETVASSGVAKAMNLLNNRPNLGTA